MGPAGREERLGSHHYLHLHFLTAASVAVERFDELDREHRGKWALLFDELELAPEWIREELFGSLRSIDARFLFKLSLSPFSGDTTPTSILSPLHGHDYDIIPLWYPHKESGYAFSEALVSAMATARGLRDMSPYELFGPSDFEFVADNEVPLGGSYGPGSPAQRRFLSLAEKDATFRRYIDARHLDLGRLHELSDRERARDVRKIIGIVAVRDAFRDVGTEEGRPRRRGRKNPDRAGATALFAMTEGNPRWLIGIVSALLRDSSELGRARIEGARQSREVRSAASRFRAFLKTIPCPPFRASQPPRGVLSVLDSIGRFEDSVFREILCGSSGKLHDRFPDGPTADAQFGRGLKRRCDHLCAG